jgi:hypothetical protein
MTVVFLVSTRMKGTNKRDSLFWGDAMLRVIRFVYALFCDMRSLYNSFLFLILSNHIVNSNNNSSSSPSDNRLTDSPCCLFNTNIVILLLEVFFFNILFINSSIVISLDYPFFIFVFSNLVNSFYKLLNPCFLFLFLFKSNKNLLFFILLFSSPT